MKKGMKVMAKKRSCRRTVNENRIHDKAVKMRKMTDVQLALCRGQGGKSKK